jgi:hypothetical protein
VRANPVDQQASSSPASPAGHKAVGMSKDVIADAAAVTTSADICAFFSRNGAVPRTFHLNRRCVHLHDCGADA